MGPDPRYMQGGDARGLERGGERRPVDLMAGWRVKRTTIDDEIARKKLGRRNVGGCVRFPIDDVVAYEKSA